MMVLVALRTPVREVSVTMVLVVLRMMAPEGRHTQGQVVHAMRVPVVPAIRAQGARAEDVHRFANDGVPRLSNVYIAGWKTAADWAAFRHTLGSSRGCWCWGNRHANRNVWAVSSARRASCLRSGVGCWTRRSAANAD